MPSNKVASEPVYTIWFPGGTRQGTAQELLDKIRHEAGAQSREARKLSTDSYAALIVKDAEFFLPRDLLAFLRAQSYESELDRALRYLSEMSNSGVRILTKH